MLFDKHTNPTYVCFSFPLNFCEGFVQKYYTKNITFCIADRTRLFVQYTISLSSLCKNIWRHWTYVCFQFTLSSCDDWENIYIYILCLIIIIKSEVWTITHCLGLGHETMVCAVCLSIFLPSGILGNCVWQASRWSFVARFSSHVNFLSTKFPVYFVIGVR